MSYRGLRTSREGKHFARYSMKGQLVETGPYDTLAELLRENMGHTSPPKSRVTPETMDAYNAAAQGEPSPATTSKE